MATLGAYELAFATNGAKIWKRDGTRVRAAAVKPEIRTRLEDASSGAESEVTITRVRAKSPQRRKSPVVERLGRGRVRLGGVPTSAGDMVAHVRSPPRSTTSQPGSTDEALERKRAKKRHWKAALIETSEELTSLVSKMQEANGIRASSGVSAREMQRAESALAQATERLVQLDRRLRSLTSRHERKGS
jgi:hypothetical protein